MAILKEFDVVVCGQKNSYPARYTKIKSIFNNKEKIPGKISFVNDKIIVSVQVKEDEKNLLPLNFEYDKESWIPCGYIQNKEFLSLVRMYSNELYPNMEISLVDIEENILGIVYKGIVRIQK